MKRPCVKGCKVGLQACDVNRIRHLARGKRGRGAFACIGAHGARRRRYFDHLRQIALAMQRYIAAGRQ
jgi:hypothetical protein